MGKRFALCVFSTKTWAKIQVNGAGETNDNQSRNYGAHSQWAGRVTVPHRVLKESSQHRFPNQDYFRQEKQPEGTGWSVSNFLTLVSAINKRGPLAVRLRPRTLGKDQNWTWCVNMKDRASISGKWWENWNAERGLVTWPQRIMHTGQGSSVVWVHQ